MRCPTPVARWNRNVGYEGIRADVGLEGISGQFDTLLDPPSEPTFRSSIHQSEMLASTCAGSAAAGTSLNRLQDSAQQPCERRPAPLDGSDALGFPSVS